MRFSLKQLLLVTTILVVVFTALAGLWNSVFILIGLYVLFVPALFRGTPYEEKNLSRNIALGWLIAAYLPIASWLFTLLCWRSVPRFSLTESLFAVLTILSPALIGTVFGYWFGHPIRTTLLTVVAAIVGSYLGSILGQNLAEPIWWQHLRVPWIGG